MKVTISGHHLNVKDSVKQHTLEKLEKISNHFPELISTNVILSIDNNKHAVAELETVYHGQHVTVKDSKDSMSQAISKAVEKLNRVLNDKKGMEKKARTDKVAEVEQDHTHEHLQQLSLH